MLAVIITWASVLYTGGIAASFLLLVMQGKRWL